MDCLGFDWFVMTVNQLYYGVSSHACDDPWYSAISAHKDNATFGMSVNQKPTTALTTNIQIQHANKAIKNKAKRNSIQHKAISNSFMVYSPTSNQILKAL